MKAKIYRDQLHEKLKKYTSAPNPTSFTAFLAFLFKGILDDEMIPVSFYIDFDTLDGGYSCSDHADGPVFEVFTVPVDSSMLASENKMRAIVRELRKSENCEGIMFNPKGEDELFVPKELILNAIDAGYQIAVDEIEAEAELYAGHNSPNDVIWQRPVSEAEFAEIADRIRAFEDHPDDFLKISFLEDDDVLFAQVLRTETEGERHLSFGYDMDDFGWDKPLVLAKEMPTEGVISMLKEICVNGTAPDDMEEIMHFKSMG